MWLLPARGLDTMISRHSALQLVKCSAMTSCVPCQSCYIWTYENMACSVAFRKWDFLCSQWLG